MHFIVIARDGKDAEALKRRMASRSAHMALGDEALKRGEQLFGAAMLNKGSEMCGSVMLVNFSSRQELDEWLKIEPYVTGSVWEDIEIIPCKVGPSFEKLWIR